MTPEGAFGAGPTEPGATDARLIADPEAFETSDVALWNGGTSRAGAWIAHPEAAIARRVRLTNRESGAQVDAAMFMRDPSISGPSIIVSETAAQALGLAPGRATPVTIVALRFRTPDEMAATATPEPEAAEAPPDTLAPEASQAEKTKDAGLNESEAESDPPPATDEQPVSLETAAALPPAETPYDPVAEAAALKAAIDAALASLPELAGSDATTFEDRYAPGPNTPVPQSKPQRSSTSATDPEATTRIDNGAAEPAPTDQRPGTALPLTLDADRLSRMPIGYESTDKLEPARPGG